MPRLGMSLKLHYMPQWLIALTLCLMLSTAPACAHAEQKDYFPLLNGAKWEYAGRFSSARGKQFSIRATSRIEGETIISGKRYFKFVTSSDYSGVPGVGRQVEDVRYYRVAEDGIYVRLGSDSDKPELREIPMPIPIDVKWLSGATEVRAERVGTVKVNGHEYSDCLKVTYKMADGVRINENYLAPGVGIVKALYVNTTAPQSTTAVVLERYTFDMTNVR